jgi:hypothetical protein
MTGTSTGGSARGPRPGSRQRGPPLRRVLISFGCSVREGIRIGDVRDIRPRKRQSSPGRAPSPPDLPFAPCRVVTSGEEQGGSPMAGISESAGAAPARPAAGAGPCEPPVTSIEQRGIEHVPHESRWGRPSSLFWMWAGAVWNVEFLIYGAIAVVFLRLSFAQAVVIIAIGNQLGHAAGVPRARHLRRRPGLDRERQ